MQSSEVVLYNLWKQAEKDDYVFDRVYRHFYNETFYEEANARLSNEVKTLMEEQRTQLIESFKNESFQPVKSSEANKETEVVCEIVYMLLEAMFEPKFSHSVHSFRANCNCHIALIDVKKRFGEVSWLISGKLPIKEMNDQVLVNIIRKRVKDEKFIRLLRKLLKVGYASGWHEEQSHSGTLKGHRLTELLSNIYFSALDDFVDQQLCSRLSNKNKSLQYVRYADAFIVGVRASKEDGLNVMRELQLFAVEHLQLKLSEDCLHFAHRTKGVLFLNYEIVVQSSVQLKIPKGTVKRFIVKHRLVKNIDEKPWKILHRPSITYLPDHIIVKKYNDELRNMYKYYAYADNVNTDMRKLHYVMEKSCLKTLASKHKSTVKKMLKKYRIGNSWGVTYETDYGTRTITFYDKSYLKKMSILKKI